MKIRYSTTTKTFYPYDIDYPVVPADVIDVEFEDHLRALAREVGETFSFDADGVLTIHAAPPPNPNDEILAQIAQIEATVTPRRMREATLNIAGAAAWLATVNTQIATLRARLVR